MPIVFGMVHRMVNKTGPINHYVVWGVVFLAVVVLAVLLRVPRLTERPVHCDEAVHAVKFGKLLEEADYRYDPFEYHGPTLNYFTLIPAWLTGRFDINDVTDATLRIVPAFFGVLLVVLHLGLRNGLGWRAVLLSMLLATVSPGMVYYSRYYIQEMLLVCFTLGMIVCGWRFVKRPGLLWALGCGGFAGLMHATKETCVIAFGAMVVSVLVVWWLQKMTEGTASDHRTGGRLKYAAAGLATAIVVSAMFFSSFFSHPSGILDSIFSYSTYVSRAGQSDLHLHPWNYYMKLMLFYRYADGPVFSEGLIVVLAVVGFIFAFRRRAVGGVDVRLHRFFAVYAFLMTMIYTSLHYKTPWCAMNFLSPMIVLAGIGIVGLFEVIRSSAIRCVLAFLLTVGTAHLVVQAIEGSFEYDADSRNPYVYAHTGHDIFAMADRIRDVARFDAGKDSYIQIICPEHDYWPFPWYLRDFRSVSYSDHVAMDQPRAAMIVASPAVMGDLLKKLYEVPPPGQRDLYVPLFDRPMQLRPHIPLDGYVRLDLLQKVEQGRSSSTFE